MHVHEQFIHKLYIVSIQIRVLYVCNKYIWINVIVCKIFCYINKLTRWLEFQCVYVYSNTKCIYKNEESYIYTTFTKVNVGWTVHSAQTAAGEKWIISCDLYMCIFFMDASNVHICNSIFLEYILRIFFERNYIFQAFKETKLVTTRY